MSNLESGSFIPENQPSSSMATKAFEALSRIAELSGDTLATDPRPLDLRAAEGLVQSVAGCYNGAAEPNFLLDDPLYDQLPETAKTAARAVASASVDYFTALGGTASIETELQAEYPAGPSDRERQRFLVNTLLEHIVVAAPHVRSAREARHLTPIDDIAQRDTHSTAPAVPWRNAPYNEAGMRAVVRTFGANFGPLVKGLDEVAASEIDRLKMIDFAQSCLLATRIHR
jgi:hypothetical protein